MPRLILVTPSETPAARRLLAATAAICPDWQLVRVASVAGAIARTELRVEFILVLQAAPWQETSTAVAELYGAFPLARLLVALDPWCGSALRRERVWPEAAAVPLGNLEDRLRREVAEIEAGRGPRPWTSSREELALCEPPLPELPPDARIAVVSPDRALRESLADLLRRAGATVRCSAAPSWSSSQDEQAVLWDVDPLPLSRREDAAVARLAAEGIPVLALTGLPSESLGRRLGERGVRAVLAKPSAPTELVGLLAGLLRGGRENLAP